jgi:hypothetical protein
MEEFSCVWCYIHRSDPDVKRGSKIGNEPLCEISSPLQGVK